MPDNVGSCSIGILPHRRVAMLMNSFAWLLLLFADVVKSVGGFSALRRLVQGWPCSANHHSGPRRQHACFMAVKRARLFYPRQVKCLELSAATVLLMRLYGVMAHLVIGVRVRPFSSHAWVQTAESRTFEFGFADIQTYSVAARL